MSDVVTRLNTALEGRYRIERQLGEGGMATVYLADDLRHERKVALKVLKPELTAVVGGERFLAEIKTTANLQHPHILPLFDSGEADTFLFYVMPYVEGESLRERLDREHQLPVDEAVRIATDVAEALQAAHEQGIVHRDVKPANILLSKGRPLVADFGIALAVSTAGGGRLTETGLSMGTPYYMSPEQASADREPGAASDVYSLGCVLYEMLVGEPPHTGGSAQAVLAKILMDEAPAPTRTRTSIPAHVDAAIRKALEKLPADRFRSAGEFAAALADPSFRHGELVGAGAASGRRAVLWGVAGAAAGALVTGTIAWTLAAGGTPPTDQLGRFVVDLPPGSILRPGTVQTVEITADGRAVVFNAAAVGGGSQLFLRRMDSLEPVPIRGTEDVGSFFLSPDGEWVGFNVPSGTLGRVPLEGGPPSTIAETTLGGTGFRGASWGEDGTIVFSNTNQSGLMRVRDAGGVPEPLTNPAEDGVRHIDPHFLPGAEQLLFAIARDDGQPDQVALLTLESGRIDTLTVGSWPHYVDPGYVVVRREDALWAAPLDRRAGRLTDEPVPVLEDVGVGSRSFSVARSGSLVFAPGLGGEEGLTLTLVDRDGRAEPLGILPQLYNYPRVSPDGRSVAVAASEIGSGDWDVWVYNLDRGTRTRITFGGVNLFFPVWAPTGDRVAVSDGTTPPNTIYAAAADGSGPLDTILARDGLQYPTSWSRDGRVLAYHENNPETRRDVWVLPLGGEPQPFLVTAFQDHAATFSPDGRWLAYVSDKSGQSEVYAQPYPGPGPELTLSTGGGTEPVWSPDGSELFYRTPTQLMAVPMSVAGAALSPGVPRPLFEDSYLRDNQGAAGTPNYDVMPDGQHFVMVTLASGAASGMGATRLILVLNFVEELARRLSGS